MSQPLRSQIKFLKKYASTGVFFALANFCNFAPSAIPAAIGTAVANVITAGYFADKNNFKMAMRVTSACTLATGFILSFCVAYGAPSVLLFSAAAALCFGVGNALASLDKTPVSPAVFYGLGYTATAIKIAGGVSMLANPIAAGLTVIGITEIAYALAQSGHSKNAAKPFLGVAGGTLFFVSTGLLTGNLGGAFTGLFACGGELSLALMEQKKHNQSHPDWANEKDWVTAPLRWTMKKGWFQAVP